MKYGKPLRYDDLVDAGQEPDFKQLSKDAYAAMNADSGEGASFEIAATERVNGMKEEFGSGVSTLIMFYNATGCTLKYRELKSDSGKLFKYNPDRVIYNGEWSCFLHVKKGGGATGSCGYVSYRMHGDVDNPALGAMDDHHLVIAWDTPFSGSNSAWADVVYSEIAYGALKKVFHEIAEDGKDDQTRTTGKFEVYQTISQVSSPLLRVVATRTGVA